MSDPTFAYAVDGELTIGSAAHHAPALLAAVTRAGACPLDLSGVTHFDGAGLQLLRFAAREATRAGGRLHVAAASRAVAAALALARLDTELQPRVPSAMENAA